MPNQFEKIEMNYIDIPDARLCYIKKGSGPAIIFIHGFCLDRRSWEDQINFFSDRFTCIAVDLRGFGNFSLPSDKVFAHHEDINALLDILQINQPVILVGLSMGARIVANFALAYPQKTKAIIFVDGIIDGYICKDFNLDYIYKAGKEKGISVANNLWLGHRLFEQVRKNPVSARLLTEMVMSYSGWHWLNKNPVKSLNPPAIEQIKNLTVPALIITGQYDIPDFQDIAQLLHTEINHSIKKEIAGAGHMCNIEMPSDFNEILNQFLIQITVDPLKS